MKDASTQGMAEVIRPILGHVGAVMALEQELKTYESNVDKWTDNAGKFVLIHGEEIVDFFAAYEDAIKAGYQKFGLEPFLVKQINAVGTAQCITRHIQPQSTVHA
jgi:hypothetical protein